MNLTVLGSGTGAIRLERGSAGYLLKVGKLLFLIDSGPGTLQRILKAGYSLNQIDALFYTHIHPDHISDLVPFLFSSKYGLPKRRKKLLIAGGRSFNDFFTQLSNVYRGWLKPRSFKIKVLEMKAHQKMQIGPVEICCSAVNHIPESIAYRFRHGEKSIVFSGDTDVSTELIELAENTDVLLLECSFPNDKKARGHLIPREAAEMARKSNPKLLLLSHFYPPCDRVDLSGQIRKAYSGPFMLAKDGMRLEI